MGSICLLCVLMARSVDVKNPKLLCPLTTTIICRCKGGSYGNKILYQNLNFFDKIFVPSKIS